MPFFIQCDCDYEIEEELVSDPRVAEASKRVEKIESIMKFMEKDFDIVKIDNMQLNSIYSKIKNDLFEMRDSINKIAFDYSRLDAVERKLDELKTLLENQKKPAVRTTARRTVSLKKTSKKRKSVRKRIKRARPSKIVETTTVTEETIPEPLDQ